jgi:hypothetical protein
MPDPTLEELASDYVKVGPYLRRKDASPKNPSPLYGIEDVLRIALAEKRPGAPPITESNAPCVILSPPVLSPL